MVRPEKSASILGKLLEPRGPAVLLQWPTDPQTTNAIIRGLCKTSRNQAIAIKFVHDMVNLDANLLIAS